MRDKNEFRSKTFKSCQILKQKTYNLSDFEIKFFPLVRFKKKIYNASDFEFKILRRVRFYRKFLFLKA